MPANAGDLRNSGSIPALGRAPGGGHGNPLQHSCLENSMGRGAWQATVHRVAVRHDWSDLAQHTARVSTHTKLWQILIVVWQNPTRHCKATVLRLKNKDEKATTTTTTTKKKPIKLFWFPTKFFVFFKSQFVWYKVKRNPK